jgi:hypothetical protein
MRNAILLVATAFAVTFAIVIGNRLSEQAMAVVVGALCGISASIPVTVGFIIAATRNRNPQIERGEPGGNPYAGRSYSQPPVYVIASSPQQPLPYNFNQGQFYLPPSAPPPGAPRDFKIIGDE